MVVLAAGCGGSKQASNERSARQTSTKSTANGGVLVESAEVRPGVAGVPAAALPGITVVGTAERSAKPDRALIGLTIGGSNLISSGQTFDLVEQSAIDPVVAAVSKAGAGQISVDRFSQGAYGGQSAAQIDATLTHPEEVDKVLAAAQEAARKHTDYNLQSVNVVFALSNCPTVEQTAWKAALADAAARAQKLADLTGVKLGNILAVSEAPFSASPYAPPTGCQAMRPPSGADILFPSAAENTQDKVTVTVTLQVTYAVTSK